jgi:hypothetical protein
VLLLSEFPQISLRMTRWSPRSTTVRPFVHHFRGRYSEPITFGERADNGQTAASPAVTRLARMKDAERRRWLLRRIEAEAWSVVHAEPMMREACWGRLLGLLEVGTAFGFWSRAADRFSNSVEHKYRVGRAIRVLRRG